MAPIIKKLQKRVKGAEAFEVAKIKNKYECDMCDERFVSPYLLEIHRKRHLNKKEFVCDKCRKTFVTECNLKSHQLTHSDERKFACVVCGVKFKRNSDLLRHMRLQHPGSSLIENSTIRPKNSYENFEVGTTGGELVATCITCKFLASNQVSMLNHTRRGHVAIPTHVYAEGDGCKIVPRAFKPEDYYESNGGLHNIILKVWMKDNTIGLSISKTTYGNGVLAAQKNKTDMKSAGRHNTTMLKKSCSSRVLLPEGYEVICEETRVVPIHPFQGTLCSSNGKWLVRNILQKVCVDTFMPPEALTYFEEDELAIIIKAVEELKNSLVIGDRELVFIDEAEEGDRPLGDPILRAKIEEGTSKICKLEEDLHQASLREEKLLKENDKLRSQFEDEKQAHNETKKMLVAMKRERALLLRANSEKRNENRVPLSNATNSPVKRKK
ncbi:zinc finger protein 76 isoform X1 [Folsomia candida]|uniref:Zinc finger protein with KRAB and SCAN domains 4 n=2 Tax=Folsomia candida TaxID=158441 RepID=A0A226DA72_FOLCA|nr:zinc finger protein 76 isoform X1 [Folsomia candida]OXA41788.1 Zinc finger protein with KRAB and SCAN domains 4 [Folsomia candida]